MTAGFWFAQPSECGPYTTPARPGSANLTATVSTKAIDTAVSTPIGDFWAGREDGSFGIDGVTIASGQSVTIHGDDHAVGSQGHRRQGHPVRR